MNGWIEVPSLSLIYGSVLQRRISSGSPDQLQLRHPSNPAPPSKKRESTDRKRTARSHSHGIGHLHLVVRLLRTLIPGSSAYSSKKKAYTLSVAAWALVFYPGHEVSIPYYSATTFLGPVLLSREVSSINTFEFSFRRLDKTLVAGLFTSSLSAANPPQRVPSSKMTSRDYSYTLLVIELQSRTQI